MQDEPIDDIIREAAEGHQPAFDDRAWQAMRQKLDTYLPQKGSKRRYLLLILLFMVGGSVAYWLLQPNRDNSTVDERVQTNGLQTGKPNNTPAPEIATASYPVDTVNNTAIAVAGTPFATETQQKNNTATVAGTKNIKDKTNHSGHGPVLMGKRQLGNGGRHRIMAQQGIAEETPAEGPTGLLQSDNTGVQPVKDIDAAGPVDASDKPVDLPHSKIEKDTAQPVFTKTMALPDAPDKKIGANTKDKKKDSKGLGNLALLVSAGGDMSFVRLSNQGKTTLLYGAGLGYTIGKRLLVRAGVYSVEKIYAASKADYSLAQPLASNPYLYQIDARCRVLEIPVSVSYYFAGQKQHRWFAGAGLSSMLMKTEQYDYQYKSAAGVNYTRSYGVNNINKHYFAILSLSAGYKYQLNKRFSLLAEPYLQLPLNGIGLGKVKLQSTGLMVTAAFRPFGK